MALVSRKICLIGDFGVGKTSLIRRFVDRQFDDRYLSTVGVKISRKQINLPPQADLAHPDLQLIIWDLEGQTRFKAIAPSYLQGAKGAILVGDVTRPETLDQLTEHCQQFCRINPGGTVIVAFNKADRLEVEQLDGLLNRYVIEGAALGIYPTSAKTNTNVDEIFQKLAQSMAN
jgi:small GTP-binding protein